MIDRAVLDTILALLASLFLGAAGDDAEAARRAAKAMLDSYGARTNRELRLAALAIAFSFGALDALSRAAGSDLAVNQVLRLRGNANALNRAAEQNEKRLDNQLRQPAAGGLAPEPVPEPELPASTATDDLVAFVRASWKAEKAEAAVHPAPLSRQQQRFADRQAEKQQRRDQERARLAERAALRDAAYAERLRQTAYRPVAETTASAISS
nr:hypothetical protein [uncultured Rhodopila sp.]